jgi:hypothetical protein
MGIWSMQFFCGDAQQAAELDILNQRRNATRVEPMPGKKSKRTRLPSASRCAATKPIKASQP